jgi:hypothetical protein
MNVIAHEGQWYLVDVGYGLGRVLDLEFARFFPPQSLTSLLAKGSWDTFRGDSEEVLRHVAEVHDLAPEATVVTHEAIWH